VARIAEQTGAIRADLHDRRDDRLVVGVVAAVAAFD